jgi:UDP-N-acetylglucosamine diphosphorylase/glucosamine-1-phosphate N-acetyltransferase
MIEDDNLVICGNVLPNPKLLRLINDLSINEALMFEGDLVAARLSRDQFDHLIRNEQVDELAGYTIEETPISRITRPWHIFELAGEEIENDFKALTKGRISAPRDVSSQWEGDEIFIEAGASVKHCILDASAGPIYIGKHAILLAGSMIKGPFVIGEHGVVKMGAKIYGPTCLGPYSKVGGEIKNSVIFGNSNKSHDGYLGNSVIGEWCNLGADTNCSNLRNDYADVSIWSHATKSYEDTNLQFCGLIMADHSKCGINTMFNTGTVVGVSCNVFGAGFLPRFIPSFSWGSNGKMSDYRLEKAIEVADRVYARRQLEFDQNQKKSFDHIFQLTSDQR